MNRQRLRQKIPEIEDWIGRTLAAHQTQACSVRSLGFARLGSYFTEELLALARVAIVKQVPVPPLTAIGLPELGDFEHMNIDGITYVDTFFLRTPFAANESVFFHELVHVVQWQYLGPQLFLMAYAVGHLQDGYRKNPLEVMAYDLQRAFDRNLPPFDVVSRVKEEIDNLVPTLLSDAQ